MSKQQRETIDRTLRDAPFDLGGDVLVQRPLLEQMLTAHPLAHDVRTTSGELGGVPVIFIEIAGTQSKGVILHIHGGGFALGSATSSVGFASDLARKACMGAITVDYRLAPEHPYPAAPHDVTAAYQALLEGHSAGAPIVVSGESAGGNLALELLIACKQGGLVMPAAAVLFSPMTDLTLTGDSYATKADVDPNITAAAIQARANDYLSGTGTDPADPL
jgi:acetyl esterase/lipase